MDDPDVTVVSIRLGNCGCELCIMVFFASAPIPGGHTNVQNRTPRRTPSTITRLLSISCRNTSVTVFGYAAWMCLVSSLMRFSLLLSAMPSGVSKTQIGMGNLRVMFQFGALLVGKLIGALLEECGHRRRERFRIV